MNVMMQKYQNKSVFRGTQTGQSPSYTLSCLRRWFSYMCLLVVGRHSATPVVLVHPARLVQQEGAECLFVAIVLCYVLC